MNFNWRSIKRPIGLKLVSQILHFKLKFSSEASRALNKVSLAVVLWLCNIDLVAVLQN